MTLAKLLVKSQRLIKLGLKSNLEALKAIIPKVGRIFLLRKNKINDFTCLNFVVHYKSGLQPTK